MHFEVSGFTIMILVIITYSLSLFIKGILLRNGYEVYLVPERGRTDIDFIKLIYLIKREKERNKRSLYIVLLIFHLLLHVSTALIILIKMGYS